MIEDFKPLLEPSDLELPAPEAAIEAIQAYVKQRWNAELPPEYYELLRLTDGFNGTVAGHGYLVLWSSALIADWSEAYEAPKWMPGFVMIGTNGGNAVYGIDVRNQEGAALPYVETDFVPMGWENVFWSGPSLAALMRRRAALAGPEDDLEEEE